MDAHRVPVGPLHVRFHDRLALHRPAEPEQGSLSHRSFELRAEGRGVRQEARRAAGKGRAGGQAASRNGDLSARPAVAMVADPRAREGRQLPHSCFVDRLAARILAAAGQHQHPGPSRLRARDHADSDRSRRVRNHLQRVLRDRSSHDDRKDLRHGTEAGRGRSAPGRGEPEPMTATTVIGAIEGTAASRTCPYTGLKVDIAAQTLIKANAVAAVIFLAVGGLMGLLVALTRWPAVHLLPAEWFYLVLTGHGANVLLFWIIFFE